MLNLRSIQIALLVFSASFFGTHAAAQNYPERPILYVVPSSAGSSVDTLARIVADGMSKALGQPVVVEDRPGAGGNIGAASVATAPADGYTVMQVNNNHTANVTLYKDQLTYDLVKDFVPVARLASAPYVFVANPSVEAKTLDEFIALAKSKPGELTYSSAGVGTGSFLAVEYLKSEAGIDLLHVPYSGGGPALTAAISGETDFFGAPVSTALPLVKEGQLRALAVSTAEPMPLLPDVPTVAQSVPGFEFSAWAGVMVPTGTPDEVVTTLANAAKEALKDPTVQKRLADLGYVASEESPDAFKAYVENDVERMRKLITSLGLTK